MTDAETLIAAEQRGGFQSVTVQLESTAAFQKFKDALTANPALAVDVNREREYYRRQSETISKVIYVIAYVVGGIMAVGAIFSALNTMYSAVSARLREIATLRAIGFGATAMVMSVLAEALLLALDRRRDRRGDRLAVLQRPPGQHLRRRQRGRSPDLRAERQPGAHRHRHHLGLHDRPDRRPVPRGSGGEAAGRDGAARHLRRPAPQF